MPFTQPGICPMCRSAEIAAFYADSRRQYFDCAHCKLVWVPSEYHLLLIDEKAEYDLHENDPADSGYRKFLSRLCEPLLHWVPAGTRGLDFGCGPGPTLSLMLAEADRPTAIYDPIYFPNTAPLASRYDFVTATEVVEHFRRPREHLAGLWRLVAPGGVLGLMTKQALDRQRFASWHYKNDPTHVCFWRRETFFWFADEVGAEILHLSADVAILRKSGPRELAVSPEAG